MWTIPNCITLFRVILIPVFVVVYFLDWRWAHEAGAFIFWLAAITDWFDGYLARKLQQSTPFGAFLDPVADPLRPGHWIIAGNTGGRPYIFDSQRSLDPAAGSATPKVLFIGEDEILNYLKMINYGPYVQCRILFERQDLAAVDFLSKLMLGDKALRKKKKINKKTRRRRNGTSQKIRR